MKRFSTLFLIAAVALVGMFAGTKKAEAVPAFARQVGVPCYSCHYQHIPKLNAFGREFKLGGFTQSAQDLITDDGLSLPPVLNASMIFKYRYQMSGNEVKSKQKKGEWQLPDEAAFLVGGRVGENMGVSVEWPGGVGSSKFVYSKDFGGIRGGVVAFHTGDLGLGYGMELFNTGLQRSQRGFEERSFMASHFQSSGPNTQAAEGLMGFAGTDLFFAAVGLGGGSDSALDAGFSLPFVVRAALTPKLGSGMDAMVGIQMVTGNGTVANPATTVGGTPPADTVLKHEAMTIDAQLQMDLGGSPLEVTFAMQTLKGQPSTATETYIYNSNAGDATSMHIAAELSLSHHAGVKAGMGNWDNGGTHATTGDGKGKASAIVVGGWYAAAQNVDLVVEHAMYSGDAKTKDTKTTIMLEFLF